MTSSFLNLNFWPKKLNFFPFPPSTVVIASLRLASRAGVLMSGVRFLFRGNLMKKCERKNGKRREMRKEIVRARAKASLEIDVERLPNTDRFVHAVKNSLYLFLSIFFSR